ncbi:hypothetical protein ACFOPX_05275 [Helicobacter baculiformis]|uniref:Methyl-accepting chemotaxis protein n=1 Tax=Helicobacter baculiformis TaxID=427351 RepID=A0ABV7ZJS4_9HELI
MFKNMTLRNKMVLAIGSVLATLIIVMSYVVSYKVERLLEEEALNRLQAQVRNAGQGVQASIARASALAYLKSRALKR